MTDKHLLMMCERELKSNHQIIHCQQRISEIFAVSVPTYIKKEDHIEAVHSDEVNEAFDRLSQRIDDIREEIINSYKILGLDKY